MSNADIRGRFVWHDLMTADTKAAGAFYPKFTGWKTQAWEKDPSYIMWTTAKGPFGGVRSLPDASRASGSHWLPYIGTPDLDATLQTAQGLGARIYMSATDVPDTGRFAVLADPQGAVFALFTPTATGQSGGASMPQEFSWHELATSDPIGALHFYGTLFGWREIATHDAGAIGIYHLVGLGDTQSIGMWKPTADMPVPTRWLSYVQIPDIDKSVSSAKAAGAKVLNGPMEVPDGTWIAHLIDPQGAPFALHAKRRVAAAATAAQPSKVTAPKSAPTAPPPKPEPPTLKARTASSAVPAAPPKVQAPATVSAAAKKPAAAKKSAVRKAPAKKAPAKKKAAAKKAVAKKSPGKKRPQKRAKAAAKKATRKVAFERRTAKKKGKSAKRRAAPGNFEIARRFAAKQADSLIKRLRGKKHR
jgi:predicted enzyme related to lactoylglutathione lyase